MTTQCPPVIGKYAADPIHSTVGFTAVWAQAEARKVLATIGARVLDDDMPVGQAHEAFDNEGRLADPQLQARLREIVTALVREAHGSPDESGALVA
jgi:chromate reductase